MSLDRPRLRPHAIRHLHHAQRRHLVGAFVHPVGPRPIFSQLPDYGHARSTRRYCSSGRSDLRSPAEFESYLSREAAFLFNNLMLVGIAFAVFWGTIFPVLSEAVRGVKITVGPPFFNQRQRTARARPRLPDGRRAADRMAPHDRPAISCAASPSPALLGRDRQESPHSSPGSAQWYVLTAFSLAAFVIGTMLVEFRRGVNARRHMVQSARQGAGKSGRQEQPPLWRLHHPSRRDFRLRRHRRRRRFSASK